MRAVGLARSAISAEAQKGRWYPGDSRSTGVSLLHGTRDVPVAGFHDLVDRGEEGIVVLEPTPDVRQMADLLFPTYRNELGDRPALLDQEEDLPLLGEPRGM